MTRAYVDAPAVDVQLGDERNLLELLDAPESRTNFLHVHHPGQAKSHENLTHISRRSESARELLVGLTSRGFYTYVASNFETRLVRERRIQSLWQPLKSGEYQRTEAGVVYSLKAAAIQADAPKLLVLLCPMHANMYSSSLSRYFPQNFKTIQKFIAPETAVLRVADLGGVVGNFYRNTTVHPDNVGRIQELISQCVRTLGVSRQDVVLYGGSKGGTGAFLHGLVGGYKVVAVDPVLSDRHYVERYNDSHFTEGSIFPESKGDLFERTISEFRAIPAWDSPEQRKVIIFSSRSPQERFIRAQALEPLTGGISSFDVMHPGIKDHPDVGPNSLPLTTTIMNNLLYGIDPPVGEHQVC